MNSYIVCIDNGNYKCIYADDYDVDTEEKIVRFTVKDGATRQNIAWFMLDNIRGFWKENAVEKMERETSSNDAE